MSSNAFRTGAALGLTMSLAAAPAVGGRAAPVVDHEAEVRAWHKDRIARLTSETGWLTVVGLFWLKEGENTFGSAAGNDLVFPGRAPARMGRFTLKGDNVTLTLESGVTVTLGDKPFTGGAVRTDAQGGPDVLKHGSLMFNLIQRGPKVGVRLKDSESEARKAFKGIETYPVRREWRVEARWEPHKEPRKIPVSNVIGMTEPMDAPGVAVFTVGGKEYRLEPVIEEPGANELFFIFADETSRTETYGAGRFLYTSLPRDGKLTIDFNKAYNPPCAFTKYATCPLPPPQNRLALRVEAGEKRYGDH
ncbi:MAG: DUF1684 domain-containing protein [Myxococcota bacterium]